MAGFTEKSAQFLRRSWTRLEVHHVSLDSELEWHRMAQDVCHVTKWLLVVTFDNYKSNISELIISWQSLLESQQDGPWIFLPVAVLSIHLLLLESGSGDGSSLGGVKSPPWD